jgi:hypothetical protein
LFKQYVGAGWKILLIINDETGDKKTGTSTDYVKRPYIRKLQKTENGIVVVTEFSGFPKTAYSQMKIHTGRKGIPPVKIKELTMKLQKIQKTSNLEQASTLLNKIDDSELRQVAAGCDGTTNYPFGVPQEGAPGARRQCHNALN